MGEGLTPRDNYCLRNGHSGAIALNARIAELEAALRELVEAVTADGSHDAVVERVDAAIRRARAALPDTAGPMTDCTRCGRPIADDGQPWCDHAVYLPDTEEEQDA